MYQMVARVSAWISASTSAWTLATNCGSSGPVERDTCARIDYHLTRCFSRVVIAIVTAIVHLATFATVKNNIRKHGQIKNVARLLINATQIQTIKIAFAQKYSNNSKSFNFTLKIFIIFKPTTPSFHARHVTHVVPRNGACDRARHTTIDSKLKRCVSRCVATGFVLYFCTFLLYSSHLYSNDTRRLSNFSIGTNISHTTRIHSENNSNNHKQFASVTNTIYSNTKTSDLLILLTRTPKISKRSSRHKRFLHTFDIKHVSNNNRDNKTNANVSDAKLSRLKINYNQINSNSNDTWKIDQVKNPNNKSYVADKTAPTPASSTSISTSGATSKQGIHVHFIDILSESNVIIVIVCSVVLSAALGVFTCVAKRPSSLSNGQHTSSQVSRGSADSTGPFPPNNQRIYQPVVPMLSVVSGNSVAVSNAMDRLRGGGGAGGHHHVHHHHRYHVHHHHNELQSGPGRGARDPPGANVPSSHARLVAARERAAQRDRGVRLQSVNTDLELDLPPSIALPDGEEYPYGSSTRLKIRDPEQESEIYQKCIRPPPNRTVFESESPPPYRCSSAGILGQLPASSVTNNYNSCFITKDNSSSSNNSTSSSLSSCSSHSNDYWITSGAPLVIRSHSMSSTSNKRSLTSHDHPAQTTSIKSDFLQKTVKMLTGKKFSSSPLSTISDNSTTNSISQSVTSSITYSAVPCVIVPTSRVSPPITSQISTRHVTNSNTSAPALAATLQPITAVCGTKSQATSHSNLSSSKQCDWKTTTDKSQSKVPLTSSVSLPIDVAELAQEKTASSKDV